MKIQKKKGILVFLMAFVVVGMTFANAESRYSYSKGQNNGKTGDRTEDINIYFPHSNNPQTVNFPPKWKEDRFILNMDKEIAKEISVQKDMFTRTMSQTYNMDMLMKPIIKPFHSIDKIYITSEFTTTLMFPSKYTVVSNFSSASLKTNDRSANTITVQAKRTFVEGNLVVTLTDQGENKLVVILMKRYIPGKEKGNDDYEIKYARNKQFVSTIITYKDLPKVDDDVLLDTMYTLYGDGIRSVFKQDCDFETFMYEGIQYFAMRDDKFGEIEFDGINFRITNKYVGCGEQSEMMLSNSGQPLK